MHVIFFFFFFFYTGTKEKRNDLSSRTEEASRRHGAEGQ